MYDDYIGLGLYGGVAQGNTVYKSVIGAELSSSGTLEGNRIYANTTAGVIVDGTNDIVDNNTIFNNPIGIQVGLYSLSSGHTIDNNTIVQTTGEALDLATAGATGTTFLDNIVPLANAVGIVAPATTKSASSATTTCTICRPARRLRPGAASRSQRSPLSRTRSDRTSTASTTIRSSSMPRPTITSWRIPHRRSTAATRNCHISWSR